MEEQLEEYQCLDPCCKHKFQGKRGPTPCEKCRSKFVKWISFKEWTWNETELWHRKDGK
jgi:hypothetical protein